MCQVFLSNGNTAELERFKLHRDLLKDQLEQVEEAIEFATRHEHRGRLLYDQAKKEVAEVRGRIGDQVDATFIDGEILGWSLGVKVVLYCDDTDKRVTFNNMLAAYGLQLKTNDKFPPPHMMSLIARLFRDEQAQVIEVRPWTELEKEDG